MSNVLAPIDADRTFLRAERALGQARTYIHKLHDAELVCYDVLSGIDEVSQLLADDRQTLKDAK